MSKEYPPLQHEMFLNEPVDARSEHQKRKDLERTIPQQGQMFKTPEIVQIGLRKHSGYVAEWLRQATPPALVLESEDTRTPEEIERDQIRGH